MHKLFAAAALSLGMVMSGAAFAHGAQPRHGGVVASAADLAFELVARDGKAVIYVDDHGRDVSTRGATGTLTVLQGTRKTQAALQPGGHNTLTSAAPVGLDKGTKAVASISLPGKEAVNVRFSVR